MGRYILELRIFFLIPSALFLIGLLVNLFLPRRDEPYLIWAGYSLILYHLAIFGLLTVLTPLSWFVKLVIALGIPILAGASLLQKVVGRNPVTGGYSAVLYVLAPGAVVEKTISKLAFRFQDYWKTKTLPDFCRTEMPALLGHGSIESYLTQVEGQANGKLLLLQSIEGPVLSDYYTRKTATRITRLLPDGTPDPDFGLNHECIPARAFTTSPDNTILLFTSGEISEKNGPSCMTAAESFFSNYVHAIRSFSVPRSFFHRTVRCTVFEALNRAMDNAAWTCSN